MARVPIKTFVMARVSIKKKEKKEEEDF